MPFLIEILLPVTQTLDHRQLDIVRSELTSRFGGVTLHLNSPAEGLWENNGDLERDRIVVIEVMTDGLDRSWWAQYRQELERRFLQEEIAIRAVQFIRL